MSLFDLDAADDALVSTAVDTPGPQPGHGFKVGDRFFSHGRDFWGVEIDREFNLPISDPMWAYVSPWEVIADEGETLLLKDVTGWAWFRAEVGKGRLA